MTGSEQQTIDQRAAIIRAIDRKPKLLIGPALTPLAPVDNLEAAIGGVMARRAVLLVCLHGRISHHSVIVGQSPDRMLLFDCYGMQFIRKHSIRYAASQSGSSILHPLIALHTHVTGGQPAPRNI